MSQAFYRAYLRSPVWSWLRYRVFQERGRRRERCGSPEQLEIHHATGNPIAQLSWAWTPHQETCGK